MQPDMKEQIAQYIEGYGLPALLETVSLCCEDNAEYVESSTDWADKSIAAHWRKASTIIGLAATQTYDTLPAQSVGERGVW